MSSSAESLWLTRPHFPAEVRHAIGRDIDGILESGRLMMGPWAKKFEALFATLTGCEHAVSVSTATNALQITLSHIGIEGKDVLVPAGSFITDVSVIEFAGGRPILVDMNPRSLALDLDDLKRKLTPQTTAMIWVHLTGMIAEDFQAIQGFARDHNLFLLEDASHAHGATVDGVSAGGLGDAGVFSFYPTKIVTSGTGGMLTTDNAALARFARELRLFGKQEGTGEVVHYGNDWFLDEIRACVGYHHACLLSDQIETRRALANQYHQCLANQPGLRLLEVPNTVNPAWYQYPVFLDEDIDRAALMTVLKSTHGFEAKGIYRPTHEEHIFRRFDDGSLRHTEETLHRSLCLPMHPGLAEQDVSRISEALVREIRAQRG